jgi:membrane protein YqaA with SNARE-associated domain
MVAGLVQAVRTWGDGAGAAGVFVVAVLDSSLLALPNATDALIMYLTIQRPALWWYYAATATAGAVLGSLPLYVLARRGGEAFLRRWLSGRRSARALAWYQRSAFAAIALPAFIPPPMPLKIFILLAGATALAPWRVVTAIALGRGARHALETLLAVRYRDQAVLAVEQYGGTTALVIMGGGAVATVAAYLWRVRRRPP